MAQQTDTDDSTDAQTGEIDVAVYYPAGPYARDIESPDPGTDRFEIGRDMRMGTVAFEDFGRDPQHAFDVAYDEVVNSPIVPEDTNDEAIVSEIFERMQGGRIDEELGYHGDTLRSMSKGDIVVVDGTPYMLDGIGYERLEIDVED